MSSTKKTISQKHADREKQESRTLTRVYYTFLLGLAAECYLFLVYRGFISGTIQAVLTWNKILNVAGACGSGDRSRGGLCQAAG